MAKYGLCLGHSSSGTHFSSALDPGQFCVCNYEAAAQSRTSGDMWNTYPDMSLSFKETQNSSVIAIKYTASLGSILLTIFSRINRYFGWRGEARVIITMKMLTCDWFRDVAAPPVFAMVQLFLLMSQTVRVFIRGWVCFMVLGSISLGFLRSCAARLPGLETLTQIWYWNLATALHGGCQRWLASWIFEKWHALCCCKDSDLGWEKDGK